MEVLHIIGGRPSLMKAAPVTEELEQMGTMLQILVLTGEHYHAELSGVLYKQLGLFKPDFYLRVGSASHALRTATTI